MAWARSGKATPAATPVAATTALAKRDVVGDVDVGSERRDDRAILLERQVDRAARLGLVHPDAGEREDEMQSGIASRLLLTTRPPQRDLQGLQGHTLLLENQHDIRHGARGRRNPPAQPDGRRGRPRTAVLRAIAR